MNPLYIGIVQKNKIIFLVLLLLFSLLSVYMPHGLFETHEHHDYESLFKHAINSSKPIASLRRLLKKFRTILYKVFNIFQKLTDPAILAKIRLVLFNMRSSKALILHLSSVLCFSFHGGKYRQAIEHSGLLPIMVV